MSAPPVLSPPRPTDALSRNPLPQLRCLVVTETDAEVVITGRVGTFYLKQLAQEAVRPTLGRRRLVNRVEVATA